MRTGASYQPSTISGIDLFCGVGGLTFGLAQSGIEITVGIDVDSKCQFPYEANNHSLFLNKDLRKVNGQELRGLFKKGTFRLLAGCAPCQPFSTYSQRGRQSRIDQKWDLLLDFGRIVKELKPDLVTMENVPKLREHSVFKSFLGFFADYHVWYNNIDCVHYGVPQTRKRLVLLASRLGPIGLIEPTHSGARRLNLRDAISELPRLAAGEAWPADPLHAACSLSTLNMRRIQASKPGGTWRDWPIGLRAKCHERVTGKTFPSVYGRMEWDTPAPTITTQCFGYGNGRFGHPDQNRAITLREASLIQTFPHDYKFISPGHSVRFNTLGRLIGNAVPVRLGRVVGESLVAHIKGFQAQIFSHSKKLKNCS